MRLRFLCLLVACGAIASAGCIGQHQPINNSPPDIQITTVSFTQIPTSGASNATVTVCWRVNGTGTIPETAVMTDTVQPNTPDHPNYEGPTYYPNNASQPAVATLPNSFCTEVKLPASGDLYLTAYATSNSTKMAAVSGRQAISVNEPASP